MQLICCVVYLCCPASTCFCPQNNPNAFRLSEHQKLEGAQALHMEETRLKMMMAIGQIPPLNESGMLEHLHEFALEVRLMMILLQGYTGMQRVPMNSAIVCRACRHHLYMGFIEKDFGALPLQAGDGQLAESGWAPSPSSRLLHK